MKQHPYCYPGTDVYRNKLDIRDADMIDQYERLVAQAQLESLPQEIPVSPEGLKAIHRHILEPVYEWAGEYRTVTTGRGAPFCKSDYIDGEINKRFAAINAEDNLRGLDPGRFSERMAEHLNELNAIHPFLDGNGRAQRALLEIVAKQAGHEADISRIDPKLWNRASIEGFHKQDNALMRDVIAGAIETGPQRQRREDKQRSASPVPLTADAQVNLSNIPAEKRAEHDTARDKTEGF